MSSNLIISKVTSFKEGLETFRAKVDIQIMNRNGYYENETRKNHLLRKHDIMIRYYEKQGILKPSRKEDNNYRTYSVMDVFLLMEIIRYQSIHFGIKDISELLNEHYLENYAQHL